jgi:hypothetical protein
MERLEGGHDLIPAFRSDENDLVRNRTICRRKKRRLLNFP